MIEEFYNNVEEKRQELEDYIEEKIPLKQYIEKYKIPVIILFILLVSYLVYLLSYNSVANTTISGGNDNNELRKLIEETYSGDDKKIKLAKLKLKGLSNEDFKEVVKKGKIADGDGGERKLSIYDKLAIKELEREKDRLKEYQKKQKKYESETNTTDKAKMTDKVSNLQRELGLARNHETEPDLIPGKKKYKKLKELKKVQAKMLENTREKYEKQQKLLSAYENSYNNILAGENQKKELAKLREDVSATRRKLSKQETEFNETSKLKKETSIFKRQTKGQLEKKIAATREAERRRDILKPKYTDKEKKLYNEASTAIEQGNESKLSPDQKLAYNKVVSEDSRISREKERLAKKKPSITDKRKAKERAIMGKLKKRFDKQSEKKKELKDQNKRLLRYRIMSFLSEKLSRVVGNSYSDVAASYLLTYIYSIFSTIGNLFVRQDKTGLFSIVGLVFKILTIGFVILAILVIGIYLPILFYLSALFIVLKSVLSFIQTGSKN